MLSRIHECSSGKLASIKACAAQVARDFQELSVIINNAGAWNFERAMSTDNIEATWAVNVLAPFLIISELLPVLQQNGHARIGAPLAMAA